MATLYIRNVPEDIHREAKALAAMQGTNLTALVIRLLQAEIEKCPAKAPRGLR